MAAAVKIDAADVEEQLERLERVHAFVRFIEEKELPDRSMTLRYRFVHVLYQNALYGSLRPTRKAQLSLTMAETLLGLYRERGAEIAANLAFLFESARILLAPRIIRQSPRETLCTFWRTRKRRRRLNTRCA